MLSKHSPLAKKFKKYIITQEEIVNDQLKEKKTISIASLKDEDFIIMKKKNDMHWRASKIFAEAEIFPRIKLELDQLKTCYELSCQGMGVTFVTDTLIKYANNENGVYLMLTSPYAKRELRIAHKKNAYISNGMKKFIEIATTTL